VTISAERAIQPVPEIASMISEGMGFAPCVGSGAHGNGMGRVGGLVVPRSSMEFKIRKKSK
jgi:hypothetical protein